MTTLTHPLSPRNSTIVRFCLGASAAITRAWFRSLSLVHPGSAHSQAERLFTTPPRRAAKPIALPARRVSVLSDARHLAVWQAGPEGAPAVLLVHGWGGTGSHLASFAPALVEQGMRVVWFDHPGHGESEGKQTALPEMVRGILAIASTCGPFQAAIGHSIGAAAIALALRRGLPLERVVLIGTPASIADCLRGFARRLGLSGEVREMLHHGIEARYGQRVDDLDRIEDLRRVAVPALLFHDHLDRHVPFSHSQRVASHLRNARLVRTHGMGHFRILRDPDVVRHSVAFVQGSEPKIGDEIPALPLPAPLY